MRLEALSILEEVIDSGLEDVTLPYVSGNSIRIKHMVVRNSKVGWLVYNSKTHTQVSKLFCKSSAIALAKSYAEGKNKRLIIEELDRVIEKNHKDCTFYKNTLNNCKDSVKREATYNRYEVSLLKTQSAKKSLDRFIFW
jgi:Fe-S-cluster containining protein